LAFHDVLFASDRWPVAACVLAVLFIVLAVTAAVLAWRTWLGLAVEPQGAEWSTVYFPEAGMLAGYAMLLTLLGFSEGLYRRELNREAVERIAIGKVLAWSTVLAGIVIQVKGISTLTVGALAAAALLNFFGMLAWRMCRRRARSATSSRDARNVLIVGSGRLGRRLAAALQNQPGGRVFCGFIDDNAPAGGDVLGRVAELARIARIEFADEIILAIPQQRDLARRAIWEARRNRLDIKVVPEVFGFEPRSVGLEAFGEVPVLTLYEERIPDLGLLLKRAVDVVVSAGSLAAAAPVLATVALAIKLDDGGPVFYRALRAGKKGRNFLCYKFRTMGTDADQRKDRLRACNQRQGPFFKIVGDPRVTRVGRFLRRYSLDELPQLLNVLRGEMSLVGPRPHPLDDLKRYELEDLRRLDVTPGLTGLWQVMARRDPSFERGMALDLEYIEHWNLWMDFRILCRTISVVVQGSGT
jgi:exopolysaccharide biosynthesis polyprenyl glycosylphosphotransferase